MQQPSLIVGRSSVGCLHRLHSPKEALSRPQNFKSCKKASSLNDHIQLKPDQSPSNNSTTPPLRWSSNTTSSVPRSAHIGYVSRLFIPPESARSSRPRTSFASCEAHRWFTRAYADERCLVVACDRHSVDPLRGKRSCDGRQQEGSPARTSDERQQQGRGEIHSVRRNEAQAFVHLHMSSLVYYVANLP